MDNNIQVVLLARGYILETSDNGQSGTKTYQEASFNPDPSGAVSLPTLGDPFSDDALLCLATNITMEYLNNSIACGRIWTIKYSSSPNEINQPTEEDVSPNEEDALTNIELASEQISFKTKPGVWRWYAGGGNAIEDQPILFTVNRASIKIYRTIYGDTNLKKFMERSFEAGNKVNSEIFYDIPQFMVLYEGANINEGRDALGNRIWRAELCFCFRTVTGQYNMRTSDPTEGGKDGWNWILALDAPTVDKVWGKPYRNGSGTEPLFVFLYNSYDFNSLLTICNRPVDFPDYSWMR